MEKSFDLLVVGFGKVGKTIAMKRAAAGDSVALIERDPTMYGGTCINIGCVPTPPRHRPAPGHRRTGLENAGIEVGERGEVVVDTLLRTSVEGV